MPIALRRISVAGVAAMLAVGPAVGDDIELFVATNDEATRCENPNVLFLIDTSGSMDALVTTQADWDPAQNYEGCYLSDSVYYSATGNAPDCGSEAYFAKSANACAAIRNTEYSGEFQAWNPSELRWVRFADAAPDWTVECAADEGVHGDGLGAETFAVDGTSGPWSEDQSGRIAWGANATTATVFDGNWLNWLGNPPTVEKTRLQIVQEVTNATLDNIVEVKVALMDFNREDGGSIQYAIEGIDTAREPMKRAIDELVTGARTSLSESLYELGQYLRGGTIEFGKPPSGESVAESRVGGTTTSEIYLSPLNSTGQNSYIILLTDGDPSDTDISANRLIEALPDYGTLVGDPCDDSVGGSCLDSMAEYLFKADLRPDIPGQQNVITHTIGFTADLPLLASTAARGGGRYFVADNTASLTRVLTNLSKDFSRTASLLTPPQVPISSFNSAERLDDVYVSVFRPAATQHWPGNVKRYRLLETIEGTILVDANGNDVIDPGTGLFRESAVSFWSAPLVDGDAVERGGAASQLPPAARRKLLSNVSGLALEEVTVDNSNVTGALIGAPEEERTATIQWARGLDSRDVDQDGITLEDRLAMGDPLHVQPVTVSYGADPANSTAVVFVSTNDGYLHALNSTDGVEIWAFIPRRLLGRLYELSLNQPSVNKEYGLDGELRVIEVANRKILLFGMRRGGEAVYAVDVTNRDAPRLLWIVDSSQPDFLDLGQTWSPPTPARLAIGGSVKDVVLFAGGYDAGQDNGEQRTDTKGNAIYVVNTLTGALEWSAGSDSARSNHDLELPRMNYSIPAAPRVLDTDRDLLTDRIYFGDMGGQVWRIDFVNGRGRTTLGEGGVLASVGGSEAPAPSRADARRFYNTPDVVDVIQDNKLFTAINIGSGYRAHPLDTLTAEEFYSIRDFRAREVIPTGDYGTPSLPLITRLDLPDITDNLTPTLEPTDAGWRLRLELPGEKVLSSALTESNVLFFTSFAPTAAGTSCLPGGGQNRLYRVSVLGGFPLTNLDQSVEPDKLTKEDRYVEIGRATDVPLEVTFGPDGPCAGTECYDRDDELAAGDADGPGDGDREDSTRDGHGATGTYWFPVTQP